MKKPIYTLDIETDPFKNGRYPKPFAIGLFDGEEFTYFWGDDCIERMRDFVYLLPPGVIYAHNGGRFDVFYLMDWILGNPMRIIKSRIIKAEVECCEGFHELRDSFAIMPFALGKFKGDVQKKAIDIKKLERRSRDKHKDEILDYLFFDCKVLWNLCSAFIKEFGLQLTIGSTAMKEFRKVHDFDRLDKEQDADIRGKYYYGGRVECFQSGILSGRFKVYDVNSMYPFVMKSARHPIGKPSSESVKIKDETFFISVAGKNHGAFPMRVKNGIRFDVDYGVFHVTRHEWDVAMQYGLFEPEKILRCVNFCESSTFEEFVTKFYSLREKAKLANDETMSLFYKFILNSCYGKFGQNPENYSEQIITDATTDLSGDGWKPAGIEELCDLPEGNFIVWSRPTNDTSFYNVATGSSITGASRSVLLRAIAEAKNPIYCDTDCVICDDLPIADVDATRLGAWKIEATANKAAIAGKKLYALFNRGKLVKQANKGVRVTAEQIVSICKGETITSKRDAPSFKLDGSYNFIQRRVRMTA